MDFNLVNVDEKREFIYKEAEFIMKNEDLFKRGVFKLIKKKNNKLDCGDILVKDYYYSITKKGLNKNFEKLKENLKKQPLKFNSLMSFNLKNMKYKPQINSMKIKRLEIEKENCSNIQTTKTSLENFRSLKNSKENLFKTKIPIKTEINLLENKLNNLKQKKNNITKKKIANLKKKKLFKTSSMKEVNELKNKQIKIPSTFFSLRKTKNKNNKLEELNKITTEKLINNLKRTQLNSILKYRNQLIKDKKSFSYNFKNTVNDYFKTHNHKNYFSLSPEKDDNRLIQTLNKYEKSLKFIPKMKKTIKQIQLIEEENEKRKIFISQYLYNINESLEKISKSFNENINCDYINSFDFSKKNEYKDNIKLLNLKYKNYIVKHKKNKSDIEIALTDIEKENNNLNYELKIWKKV